MKKFSRIMLTVLAVLLTVVLTVTSLSASLISCVRAHFTPEYVYNFMNSIDYASLELPDGEGNTAPLCDIINDQVRDFGIYFTENDINDLIRTFSIDAVIASYMQDVRTWALDDGPVPVLDAGEVASTILSGLDNSLYMFLGLFGNPEQILTDAIGGMVSAVDFSEMFERGETVRSILAEDSLIFIISLCGTLFLLILFTQRLRLVPTAVYTGISCIVSGSVMLFAQQIIAPFKTQLFASSPDMLPEKVVDMVYLPFMETVHRTGTFVSLGGLAAVIVFAVIGIFWSMYMREKERSLRRTASGTGFGMPYDYMTAGFENAAGSSEGTAAQPDEGGDLPAGEPDRGNSDADENTDDSGESPDSVS